MQAGQLLNSPPSPGVVVPVLAAASSSPDIKVRRRAVKSQVEHSKYSKLNFRKCTLLSPLFARELQLWQRTQVALEANRTRLRHSKLLRQGQTDRQRERETTDYRLHCAQQEQENSPKQSVWKDQLYWKISHVSNTSSQKIRFPASIWVWRQSRNSSLAFRRPSNTAGLGRPRQRKEVDKFYRSF